MDYLQRLICRHQNSRNIPMKNFTQFLLICFLCTSTGNYAQDLKGNWTWKSDDGQKTFTMELDHISKDRLNGVHCVEDFETEIVECYKMGEDEYSVSLVRIAPNLFQGNLVSVRGKEMEVRDIQIQYLPEDDTILFSLTKIPETPFRVPKKAVLSR